MEKFKYWGVYWVVMNYNELRKNGLKLVETMKQEGANFETMEVALFRTYGLGSLFLQRCLDMLEKEEHGKTNN